MFLCFRLSRKQLPAVDLNGSVRYSTPSGESEIEWISIGSATTSPQCLQHGAAVDNCNQECCLSNTSNKTEIVDNEVVNNYLNNQIAIVPISNAQSKTNYWKSNARRVETKEDGSKREEGNESDWSADSAEAKVYAIKTT